MITESVPKRVLALMRPYMELNEAFGGVLSHFSTHKYRGARTWRAIYYPTFGMHVESVEVVVRYDSEREEITETVNDVSIPILDVYTALAAYEAYQKRN